MGASTRAGTPARSSTKTPATENASQNSSDKTVEILAGDAITQVHADNPVTLLPKSNDTPGYTVKQTTNYQPDQEHSQL